MAIVTSLRQSEIFADLTHTQLELVASVSAEQSFRKHEIIFNENTPGTELYIVTSGSIEIFITTAVIGASETVEAHVLTVLRRGQSFGEVALVDEGLRSAGARAAERDTELIIIPRERLIRMCDSYPDLGYRLMRNLAADLALKLRSTDLQLRQLLQDDRRG
jgi:CRP-like cAMP-binding protein